MAIQTFNMALAATFEAKIKAEINAFGQQVAAGAMSYDQYKFTCGIIKGFQLAADVMKAAEKEIQTAERGEDGSKGRR